MKGSRGHRQGSSFSQFERAGETYDAVSNSPLPRAQERVQQALERDSLIGGMGGTPISASSVQLWPRRYGLKAHPPLAERLSRSQQFKLFNQLKVRAPQRVLFCHQRQIRREVLFALNRAGFGGSAKKRHWRRTQNSQYRC